MAMELTIDEKLYSKIESWRDRLLDIGNRNPLVNMSFSPTRGALELLYPATELIWSHLITDSDAGTSSMRFTWKRDLVRPPKKATVDGDEIELSIESTESTDISEKEQKDWNPKIEECLDSLSIRDVDLLTQIGDRSLDRRLRKLGSYAELSLSEQGVHSLFLAFGFLKWFENTESTKELRSPLLLVPAMLSRVTSDAPWELLEAEDDVIDNLCLRQRLKQDFALDLPPLPEIDKLEEQGARVAYLELVRDAISKNERWEVEERCCIGRFAFPKIAMWQDLGEHLTSIGDHPLCKTVGGDDSAGLIESFGDVSLVPEARQLDDVIPPGELKAILDCDSSQLEAIVAARKGVSFVLDGPPGTGKSQTIANIIADAISVGKRVLFVSEKVSALEVVKRRLDDCNLGDFCLECHSTKANRKTILEELKWCLDLREEVYQDATTKLEELKESRQLLNEYVRSIHKRRDPLGMSAYEVYANVSRLTRLGMLGKSRIHFEMPESVSASKINKWVTMLDQAKELKAAIENYHENPWKGCRVRNRTLTLKDDIRDNFGRLAQGLLEFEKCLRPLANENLIAADITLSKLSAITKHIDCCVEVPVIPSDWFSAPHKVAALFLEREQIWQEIEGFRAHLSNYVDDVADIFTTDLVTLGNWDSYFWLTRLQTKLPDDYRESEQQILGHSSSLSSFIEELDSLQLSLKNLISETKLPIKSNVMIGTIPKLAALARLITEVYPFQKDWFNSQRSDELRLAAQQAICELDSAAKIDGPSVEKLSTENLVKLVQTNPDPTSLRVSWNEIQTLFQCQSKADVTQCLLSVAELTEPIGAVQQHFKTLATCLQLDSGFLPSAINLSNLVDGFAAHGRVMEFHGNWTSSSVRKQLRLGAESALSDLQEAKEIRESLETRLSHRAFLPAARLLADRGLKYESFWGRTFGGFKAFLNQILDLYKAELPATKQILADLARLRTFHKRNTAAIQVAEQNSNALFAELTYDSPESWTSVQDRLREFEQLLNAVPDLGSAFQPVSIRLDRKQVDYLTSQLTSSLASLTKTLETNSLKQLVPNDLPINDLSKTLFSGEESLHRCKLAWDSAASSYQQLPLHFDELLDDIETGATLAKHLKQVQTLFDSFPGSFSGKTSPLDRQTWVKTIEGIDAAEKLTKTFGASKLLIDVCCADGQIFPEKLAKHVDEVGTAFAIVENSWTAVQAIINLDPIGLPTIDTKKRELAEFRKCVSDASAELTLIGTQLGQFLRVTRPGCTLPLSCLREDAVKIEKLKKACTRLGHNKRVIEEFSIKQVERISAAEIASAKWILECPTKIYDSPLARVVATDQSKREIFADVALQAKRHFAAMTEPGKFFEQIFDSNQKVSFGFIPGNIPIGELAVYLLQLVGYTNQIDEWIGFDRWRRELNDSELALAVSELLDGKYSAVEAKDAVCARFFEQLFDSIVENDPLLEQFDGLRHEQVRDRFRQLDAWEIKAAATRVREYQLNREDRPRIGFLTPPTSELGVLKRETEKKRRHMPLRKLFNEIPSVLQRLKPCIMMSPLSVSTFLQSNAIRFDLVVFDEASQVFPWDAIGSIYRGTQLIVAGDDKQLPPTSFFSRSETESSDEDEDDIGDFESILTLCKSVNMPSKRLRWHYRSRREPLIAFSNKHFYNGDLVTFPSVRDAVPDAVRLEHVPKGRWVDRRNLVEAQKVADLVIDHHRMHPHKSLGVIAFNATQQQAIEDAIFDRRRASREIDALLEPNATESMFIKNLENVQGDERDVIFLSFAYGLNEAGKFLKNFGPLSKPGGERRLNVAVTRAREKIVLVSSVRASDMDLSNSTSLGAQLMKGYLEYAEHGVDMLGRKIAETAGEFDSPFEEEVAAALVRRGIEPVSQVGCGGFRIDLAIRHPQYPGQYCLGIECDGTTYHSSHTARDRDRIRQSILEDLGWKIVRIWSTDWVRDSDRQVRRILDAYELASLSVNDANEVLVLNGNVETASEDLEPQYVEAPEKEVLTYQKIEDVPFPEIAKVALGVLGRVGAIDWNELIVYMARDLGFARTGKKIRETFERVLLVQLHKGEIHRAGERVYIP